MPKEAGTRVKQRWILLLQTRMKEVRKAPASRERTRKPSERMRLPATREITQDRQGPQSGTV